MGWCRIGLHRWSKYEAGGRYVDVSFGGRVPMREYLSFCQACGKPRRKAIEIA